MKKEDVDVHVLHEPEHVLHDVGCQAGLADIEGSCVERTRLEQVQVFKRHPSNGTS